MESRKDEIYQPIYPALEACLVVDARWGSRHDILKDLKASSLFDEIVQAKFVDDGLNLLRHRRIDACFIGPSITAAKAIEFIVKGRKIPNAKDCAFIVVLTDEQVDPRPFMDSGCHQVILKPCSKRKFCEGIVRGVLAANADGIWAGIALAALEQQGGKVNEGERLARQVYSNVEPALKKIVNGYKAKVLSLNSYGEPNEEAQAAIEQLFSQVMKSHAESEIAGEFAAFFKTMLHEWFVDLASTNEKIATSALRRKMSGFRTRRNC